VGRAEGLLDEGSHFSYLIQMLGKKKKKGDLHPALLFFSNSAPESRKPPARMLTQQTGFAPVFPDEFLLSAASQRLSGQGQQKGQDNHPCWCRIFFSSCLPRGCVSHVA